MSQDLYLDFLNKLLRTFLIYAVVNYAQCILVNLPRKKLQIWKHVTTPLFYELSSINVHRTGVKDVPEVGEYMPVSTDMVVVFPEHIRDTIAATGQPAGRLL